MSIKTAIQWTDATWNIARGCTKVDEDCKFCYMYRDSFSNTRYNPLEVVRTKTVFNLPLRIKEPSKIFTCSLTDFFHEKIDSYRHEAWDIIRKCPQHTFQILTKRPERISDCLPADWGDGWDNVWLGTSVGSEKGLSRMYDLYEVKCKIRFLSLEPLWSLLDLSLMSNGWLPSYNNPDNSNFDKPAEPLLCGFDWVIVGGESGNETGKYRYRPCDLKWIELIVKQCKVMGIPVFVKQLGTYLSKQLKMSDRHGGNIDEFPEHLQIREFPPQQRF